MKTESRIWKLFWSWRMTISSRSVFRLAINWRSWKRLRICELQKACRFPNLDKAQLAVNRKAWLRRVLQHRVRGKPYHSPKPLPTNNLPFPKTPHWARPSKLANTTRLNHMHSSRKHYRRGETHPNKTATNNLKSKWHLTMKRPKETSRKCKLPKEHLFRDKWISLNVYPKKSHVGIVTSCIFPQKRPTSSKISVIRIKPSVTVQNTAARSMGYSIAKSATSRVVWWHSWRPRVNMYTANGSAARNMRTRTPRRNRWSTC